MKTKIEALAREIVGLGDNERQALFKEVSDLALRKGLNDLAKSYTDRLKAEKKAIENKEVLLEQLRSSRDRIAGREYGSILGNS